MPELSQVMTLDVRDGVSPAMLKLLKKSRNMKKAMQQIETRVIKPMAEVEWSTSGLKSRSGELKHSVVTFSGKKSAGLSVHTSPGHDLIIPKAVTHTRGAKRHEFRRKQRITVKRYSRKGRTVSGHARRNRGAPWGKIPVRRFIPTKFNAIQTARVVKILKDYINA